MTAIELIRLSLAQSRGMVLALLADMRNEPLTAPTPHGGNHPLWVLGHLAYSESALVAGFLRGEANPLAKWEGLFGIGSQPITDAGKYPSWDELMAEYERARANTLKTLDTYSDADLDRPSLAPENRKELFGTVGRIFMMLTLHTSFHAGQVADARRAAGKKPVRA